MILTELHKAICTTLKEEIPAIQTCEVYPTIRKELVAPAVFVELVSLEPGKDPIRVKLRKNKVGTLQIKLVERRKMIKYKFS